MRVIKVRTSRGVAAVAHCIGELLRRREIELFARIDHSAGARAVGLELADEVLLIFGSPAVGTGLMQEDPDVGLELPLRMLIRAVDGGSEMAFHDPRALAAEFDVAHLGDVLQRLYDLLVEITQHVANGEGSSSAE